MKVDFVYVGAFSGWLEGKVKTSAGKAKRRGDSPAARGTKINSGIGSNSYWLIYPIHPSLDW